MSKQTKFESTCSLVQTKQNFEENCRFIQTLPINKILFFFKVTFKLYPDKDSLRFNPIDYTYPFNLQPNVFLLAITLYKGQEIFFKKDIIANDNVFCQQKCQRAGSADLYYSCAIFIIK